MSIDIFLLLFSFIFTPLLFYNLVKMKEHKLHSRNQKRNKEKLRELPQRIVSPKVENKIVTVGPACNCNIHAECFTTRRMAGDESKFLSFCFFFFFFFSFENVRVTQFLGYVLLIKQKVYIPFIYCLFYSAKVSFNSDFLNE